MCRWGWGHASINEQNELSPPIVDGKQLKKTNLCDAHRIFFLPFGTIAIFSYFFSRKCNSLAWFLLIYNCKGNKNMNGYIVYTNGKRVSSVVSYSIACDIAAQCRAAGKKYVNIQRIN